MLISGREVFNGDGDLQRQYDAFSNAELERLHAAECPYGCGRNCLRIHGYYARCVERRRDDCRTGAVTVERAYHLLSFDDVELFALCAKSHWGMENDLHWQLDSTFADDANRTAEKESAASLSAMERFVLSLISIVKDCYKGLSMKCIRRSIGWGNGEEEFLAFLAKSGHLV